VKIELSVNGTRIEATPLLTCPLQRYQSRKDQGERTAWQRA